MEATNSKLSSCVIIKSISKCNCHAVDVYLEDEYILNSAGQYSWHFHCIWQKSFGVFLKLLVQIGDYVW